MHRSGTSLIASALHAAGIPMGREFLGPGPGNPRGHFEDFEFYRFHVQCLERRGISPFDPPDGWTFEPTADEEQEAARLVSERGDDLVWGFKDPRVCLFLDFWRNRLPSPLFVFVYRHPAEVVLSLLRRGLDGEILEDPARGFSAWTAYNRRLLDFRARHGDGCLLWRVDEAAISLEDVVETVFRVASPPVARQPLPTDLFHETELRAGLHDVDLDWRQLAAHAMTTFDELDLVRLRTPSPPSTTPRDREHAELHTAAERDLARFLRQAERQCALQAENERASAALAAAVAESRRISNERDALVARFSNLERRLLEASAAMEHERGAHQSALTRAEAAEHELRSWHRIGATRGFRLLELSWRLRRRGSGA